MAKIITVTKVALYRKNHEHKEAKGMTKGFSYSNFCPICGESLEKLDSLFTFYKCSNCDETLLNLKYNFCPNCGIRFEEVK